MYAQTEQGSVSAYQSLLDDLHTGAISVQRVRAAAHAILALKHVLSSP